MSDRLKQLLDFLKPEPTWVTPVRYTAAKTEDSTGKKFSILTDGVPRLQMTFTFESATTNLIFTLEGLDNHIAELIRQRDLLAAIKPSDLDTPE